MAALYMKFCYVFSIVFWFDMHFYLDIFFLPPFLATACSFHKCRTAPGFALWIRLMICFLVSLGVLYVFTSSLFLEELQALR